MKEQTYPTEHPFEESEWRALQQAWQRTAPAPPAPLSPEAYVQQIQAGRLSQHEQGLKASRRRVAMALTLLAATLLLLLAPAPPAAAWPAVAAIVLLLVAAGQALRECRRHHLLRHMRPARHAPARHAVYARRLQRMESRRALFGKRPPAAAGLNADKCSRGYYRANAALLTCCLALAVATTWRPAEPAAGADLQQLLATAQYGKLLCNMDCDTTAVLTELFEMVHYV